MSKQASSGHHFDLNRCLVSKRADSQKRRNHRSAILSLAAVSAVSLGGAGLAQAAESEVLGWNTAGVSVASNSTPLMADTVNSALGGTSANIGLLYGPGFYPNGYFGPGFNGNDNGSGVSSTLAGAEAAGLYFQFTLPASTGQPLNVDAIDVANWFALQRNTPYTFYVTSSLDNYATALGTASVTPTGDLSSLNVPVSSLQGLTAPVTIRIDLSIQAAASNQTFGFSGRGPGQTSDALQVLGTFGAVAVPLTWTGGDGSGGYGTWNSTLSNSWKATTGGAVATYADGDAVTFDSSGVNTSITVDSGGVQPGAITFSNDAAHPYSFNGGPIGGTALTSVTLSGAGSVTLNNSNTYFGGTTVNNGTLSANADGALGTGAVTVTGGKLNANTDGAFPWGSINSGYSGIIPLTVNGGTVNFTSAGPSVSSLAGTGGSVVLSNTNLTLGGDGTSTTYAGTIGQAASTSGSITKVGNGTFSLSGSNTYSGGTTISQGTLLAINARGSATGSGNVTVASGATLGGSGILAPSSGNSVTIQNGGILAPHTSANGYSTLTVDGTLNLNSGSVLNFNFGSAGNDEVIASSIVFPGDGSSETLNVNFPGGTALPGLFPILQASSFSGQGTPVFSVNGPSIDTYTILAPGASGNTFANTYTLKAVATAVTAVWTGTANSNWDTVANAGGGAAADTNWNCSAGTLYVDGMNVVFDDTAVQSNVSVGWDGVQPASITFNNNTSNYTFADNGGSIHGPTSVTLNGSGTVNFKNGNNYTGGTFLNNGVLEINDPGGNSDNSLGNAPSSNAVNLTFNGGTLEAGSRVQLSSTRTLQLNAGGGTLDTNGYELEVDGNVIQGPGALTATGGGILRLDNPHGYSSQITYSGGTIVNGTTIDIPDNQSGSAVSGGSIVSSIFGTGPVTLNNGAGLIFNNWDVLTLTNAVNLSGTVTYTNGYGGGDGGHGLFITNTDENGNAMATANVTTIAAGGATLNLSFASPDLAEVDQQIVGGRLTVNNLNGSTGAFVLTNASNNFKGLTIASGAVLVSNVGALGTGPLIVNGGAAIFSNTTPAAVFSMLQSGYHSGAWNGSTGINSTAAAGDTTHLHAVGMLQPSGNITVEGQNVNNSQVVVKYTYYGDANLDGRVDGSDYSLIDNAYLADQASATAYTGWQNGDFNYDGVVNGSDYTLIDNAFNTQGAQIADAVASPAAVATAQLAGGTGTSAVPEPTSLGLLGIGALGLLGRSRRRGLR